MKRHHPRASEGRVDLRFTKYLNPFYIYQRRDMIRPALEHRLRDAQGYLSMGGLPATANHRRLSVMRNRHLGEIGFLIGSGPSVRIEDLERLNGAVTFCSNRFHLAYPRMTFRPSYTASSDRQMVEDFGQEIVEKSAGEVFVCSENPPNYTGEYVWLRIDTRHPWSNPAWLPHSIYHTGATLLAALQIGLFMGIRRFIVYGVDHDFTFKKIEQSLDLARCVEGEGNHFIDNYRSGKPWAPPQMELIENSFRFYDNALREKGGWLLNATRGGKLEVLERVDFDQIVPTRRHFPVKPRLLTPLAFSAQAPA